MTARYSVVVPSQTPVGETTTVSLLALATVLLRHLRLLVGVPAIFLALAVAWVLIKKPLYVAQSHFMPQAPTSNSRLATFAAQLGLALPGLTESGESVDFYADLVNSSDILRELAETEYRFATEPGGTDSLRGEFAALYDIRGVTPRKREQAALRSMRASITIVPVRRSGMVKVMTRARWPELAELLNRRVLVVVAEFNQRKRQSQAGAERRFIEGRLAAEKADLDKATQAMTSFLNRNRRYQSSPDLQFQQNTLQREVDIHRQVYTSLAQAYEQARIEEVRNTPVITVVEAPEGTAVRSRGLIRTAVLAIVLGLLIAMGGVVVLEHVRTRRENEPGEYEAFAQAKHTAVASNSPVSWLRRLGTGRKSDEPN